MRADLAKRRISLATDFPGWQEERDARATVFAKLANTLRASELALGFLQVELDDPQWWLRNRSESVENGEFRFEHMAFSQLTKGGLLQSAFAAVDSSFRLYLRALDPEACSRATAEFKSVSDCLLQSHLGMLPTEAQALELFRTVRNLVHNDGVFFHRKHDLIELEYRGEKYRFEYAKPIEFATWAFLLGLTSDLIRLLDAVVRRGVLASYDAVIVDPWTDPAPVA